MIVAQRILWTGYDNGAFTEREPIGDLYSKAKDSAYVRAAEGQVGTDGSASGTCVVSNEVVIEIRGAPGKVAASAQ